MAELTERWVRDVKHALTDPRLLVERLGWTKGAQRTARGVMVCCPVHAERTPSCSVRVGERGTIQVHCFGCEWGGDVLTAIAVGHGLDPRRDFREVLALGAEMAGHHSLADEIRAGQPRADRKPVPQPAPLPERPMAAQDEMRALWEGARKVTEDDLCVAMLRGRAIDPAAVAELDLARAIADGQRLPRWAGSMERHEDREDVWRTWRDSGHRLLVPTFDHLGAMRAIRGWRVTEGDTPKRLPPAGRRSAGGLLANREGRHLLLGVVPPPSELFLVEGEPDFLVASTTFGRGKAVLGVLSGGWNEEFAKRIPANIPITIATHNDEAGDKYAKKIVEDLKAAKHTLIWRWERETKA